MERLTQAPRGEESLTGGAVQRHTRASRLVAAREVRARAASKSFVVGTVVSLLVVAGLVLGPALLAHKGPTKIKVAFIVKKSSFMGKLVESELLATTAAARQVGAHLVIVPEATESQARAALLKNKVAAAVVPGPDRAGPEVLVRQLDAGGLGSRNVFASDLARQLARQETLAKAKLGLAARVAVLSPKPVALKGVLPALRRPVPLATALVVTVFLFAFIQQYGIWVLLGVVEEKASRLVEILMSAISARQLLRGKVVGIGMVALAQAGATVLVALVLGLVSGSSIVKGLGPALVGIAAIWFLLGYGFYCFLFAAAGSLVSRQEDAQNVAFPLLFPLIIGYFAAFSALIPGRANIFVKVLAYLPPTAPIAMPVLYSIGQVLWWQMLIAAVIVLASTWALSRAAGSIYERAVLRSGPRIAWREAIRLAR
jgi:ABC-2 type transport system permease protein